MRKIQSTLFNKNYNKKIAILLMVVLGIFSLNSAYSLSYQDGFQLESDTFVKISRDTLPSVVSITAKSLVDPWGREISPDQNNQQYDQNIPQNEMDELFRQFFGPNFRGQNFQPQPREVRVAGSGVIVREDGYIVTNAHVVKDIDKDKIEVLTYGEKKYTGDDIEMVKIDSLADIAIIKIKAKGLKPIEFADSNKLEVGEWAVALGSPLDFNNSVTQGIISARHRSIGKSVIEDLIQTTAIINPGNSGGPLVNIEGKLIGINVAIVSNNGLWQGMGFAIPSNAVKLSTDALIDKGVVNRGYLGIKPQELTPEIAKSLGYTKDYGVLIFEITKDGPAEKAGLKPYDIIIDIDGKPMKKLNDIFITVAEYNPTTTVGVRIYREEFGEKVIKVKLAERPAEETVSDVYGQVAEKTYNELGLKLRLDTAQEEKDNQVVVDGVKQDSPAYNSGIQRADIIVEVNKVNIKSISDFDKAIKSQKKGRSHLFMIRRGNLTSIIIVPSSQ